MTRPLIRSAIRTSLVIGVLTLGLFSASAAPATSRGAAGSPLATGVSYVTGSEPVEFQRVASSGATLVHMWLRWADVAPEHPPVLWNPRDPTSDQYRWGRADEWVRQAVAAGLTPLLQVYDPPIWAQGCQRPALPAYAPCKLEAAKLADFAYAAARRYGGRFPGLPKVRYWQALNEPNLNLYFTPQFENGRPVAADLYRRLLNAFYVGVKAANRSSVVLAGGLGPIARPGATIGPMRFTRELLCMRGRNNPRPTRSSCEGGVRLDTFDIHPYTTGGPTHRGKVDDVQLGDLVKLKELLRAADDAGRIKGLFKRTPLWITELSWDSRPPDPGGVPMRILKRWTAEALYRAWAAGVSRFFWFSLSDVRRKPDDPFSETLESGLYFRGATVAEDRPKPHMYAFRFPFVAYSRPSGFYFWGRTPSSQGGRVLLQIRKGGEWRGAGAVRADRHGIFEGKVEGFYGRRKRGWVRAVYRRERSVPFSLKPVRDFYQPPFGRSVE